MIARVYAIGAFVSLAGYLFGADTGSIGSITTMPQFKAHFGELKPIVQGLLVSSILLPWAISGLAAGTISDRISRKYTITTGCLMFAFGSALCAGSPSLVALFVGRCLAGVGEGFFLASMAVYVCEISPKESRGRILSIVQLFISCGIAIGFFICYGSVNIHSSLSWRLPFILQTAISVVIAIGCVFLPFSPRWLMHKGRTEEADRVLDYLDKRMAEAEKEEIKAAQEEASTKDFKVQELWEQRVRKRTFLTVFMQVVQQLAGIDAVLYYAPLLFMQAGLTGTTAPLVASGVSAIVHVLATLAAQPFTDRVTRRALFLGGGVIICGSMFMIGTLYASGATRNQSGRWAVIAFIEIFLVSFSVTWAIVVRMYTSEIHPIRTRSAASCLGTSVNQLVNFLIAMTTPLFLAKTSSGPYFMFAGCTFVAVLVCWFAMLETAGKSLESISAAFDQVHSRPFAWKPSAPLPCIAPDLSALASAPTSDNDIDPKAEEIEMDAMGARTGADFGISDFALSHATGIAILERT